MSTKKQNPGLGAFAAPVTFRVTVGGQAYEFKSNAITLTPSGTETVRSLSGVGSFLPVSTPPPPPPPLPAISGIQDGFHVPITSANSGSVVFIEGQGFGSAGTVTFAGLPLTVTAWSDREIKAVLPVVAADTTAAVMVQAGTHLVSSAPFTVNFVGPTPPPPPPPPPGTLNVRDYGVKGDGATDDVTALNALIRTAKAGAILHFPAGTYILRDALKVFRSDLAFEGEGDASILKSVAGSYHVQIGSGQPYTGLAFRNLHFYGTPGAYMADGTSRGGVLNFGSKGTVFENCLFTGCAEPILNAGVAGSTYGTVVKGCRFNGWGRMCCFLNGGERVSNCRLIQDDPNLFGERSSHGFYIHGGCKDVEIADTEIANARKYALQVYSESEPSVTDNIRLLRLNIHDCANGIITAHGNPTAGRLTNGLIEGCHLSGIYAGSSLAIKNGEGLIVRGNVIDGNTGAAAGHSGAGIYLGVWAPYEPGFSLKDVQVIANAVRGCDRGIWSLPSNGGTFTNCAVSGNLASGCRMNYDINGSGIQFTPGMGHVQADETDDLRPGDDSSREAKELMAGGGG